MTSPAVQRWLHAYCDRSHQVAAGLVLLRDGHGELRTAAAWPERGAPGAPLVAVAKAAAQRAEPVLDGSSASRLISLPLRSGAGPVGAVALSVDASDTEDISDLIRKLEHASAVLAPALESSLPQSPPPDAVTLLEIQALVLSHGQFAAAATAFATDLANRLALDRVSIGMLGRGRIDVIAISHGAELDDRRELVRAIAAAMEEATDQGASVVYPAAPTAKPRIVLAHAELATHGGTTVCSVPLVSAGRPVGALTLERRGAGSIPSEQVLLCEHIACLAGPLLALKQRAERSWWANAADALRGNRWPTLAAAGVLAAASALAVVPLPYRVGAPARIEGAVQRVLAAPADGFLRDANVRPGAVVRAGDVLVELADQDLALEQRRWESELAQHENSLGAALARGDRAQFVMSNAKADEARAQLDLVKQQLARSRVTAPIDGVVIEGDLSQSLGAPVKRGEHLLTIAPNGQFRLMIAVDERDIGAVDVGQPGRLALAAFPASIIGFTVERITPVAKVKDGRNSFEVEAKLDATDAPLRPGLEGVAKIESGRRALGWIWTHRIVDWLRLSLWSRGL